LAASSSLGDPSCPCDETASGEEAFGEGWEGEVDDYSLEAKEEQEQRAGEPTGLELPNPVSIHLSHGQDIPRLSSSYLCAVSAERNEKPSYQIEEFGTSSGVTPIWPQRGH
jgi:hypothetical protein